MIIAIRGLGGNVSTTMMLGLELLRNGPMDRLQHGSSLMLPLWRNIPLPDLDTITFAGWDVCGDTIEARVRSAKILSETEIESTPQPVRDMIPRLAPIRPGDVPPSMIKCDNAKHMSAGDALAYFRRELSMLLERDSNLVGANLSSAEAYNNIVNNINDIDHLYALISSNSDCISSGMTFIVACIELGIPCFDFTADQSMDCPALGKLALNNKALLAGKDGNTGQTFLKVVLGEMFAKRNLKINDWYSTNVLGNLDGKVLSIPTHRQAKIQDKALALASILEYDFHHTVDIAYHPNRGDIKEAWDSIQLEGWLGHRISLRLNWYASDSILAAPLVLDISRLLALSKERGEVGLQTQLSPFFKRPIGVTRTSIFHEFEVLERHYAI